MDKLSSADGNSWNLEIEEKSMYRYGDEKMDFSEAVLIAKVRLSPEDLDRYFAQDIALAIKTIINSLDDEIRKAKEGGYIKGCMDTEKEKNKIIEKLLEERA